MIQKMRRALLLSALVLLSAGAIKAQSEPAFDVVITNGHIVDGTGSPWYSGDLGLRAGKIARWR